jgi:DNA polymerase I-like protein with 3'-5' exonuclease and polymerase domains
MIYLVGNSTNQAPFFETAPFELFQKWVKILNRVEFDIETSVTPYWCDKQLITVQFGWRDTQWILQWSELTEQQKETVKQLLEGSTLKIIHNAAFECIVMLFHKVRVQNVVDTMLAEMVLYGGDQDVVSYALDDVVSRRLGITLDKTYQTAFGDNILTPGKIWYAAQDVTYMGLIHLQQCDELAAEELTMVAALEYEAVLGFSEMTFEGMEIVPEVWRKLQDEAEPLVAEAHARLTEWVVNTSELYEKALTLKYISKVDTILLNWASPKQTSQVFAELFPELPGTTKSILKRYISNCIQTDTVYPEWLPFFVDGDKEELTKHLIATKREWLIENDFLIPAGQCTLNWNSTDKVLPLLQVIEPQLKNLNAESMGRVSHPIALDYEDYKDSLKLISSFGEKFLHKHVEPDGMVRTSFNQIMTTGRIASSKPNMQQIPAKESVGNKYRNAFHPPKGWKFVSSDFASQELVVIAYLSKDPVWQEALGKGQDLHSIAAELVFGKKWVEATQPNCAYYELVVNADGKLVQAKEKCKCKGHKLMRTGCKTINFGLAYGMSHFKLAGTLRISVKEAKQLIVDYFKAFPGIGALLEYLGKFGIERGYIQTIYPFYRKRYFPFWKFYKPYIQSHLSGMQYHPSLGEIERASKNMPIQGASADMCKVAVILIYWYIHDNKLEDKVKLKLQVHDQVDTVARADFADQWAPILTWLMEEAARVIIPTGILKAETTITDVWSK